MTGIGIDTEDIETFRKHDMETSARFYKRIFTPDEIAYCTARPDPYPHFAARFAAKEAVIKAMWPERVLHSQVEIRNRPDGSPFVRLLREGVATGVELRVSLSHSNSQAVACALAE